MQPCAAGASRIVRPIGQLKCSHLNEHRDSYIHSPFLSIHYSTPTCPLTSHTNNFYNFFTFSTFYFCYFIICFFNFYNKIFVCKLNFSLDFINETRKISFLVVNKMFNNFFVIFYDFISGKSGWKL